MHIHFREFFWSFFAVWNAVVPDWDMSDCICNLSNIFINAMPRNTRPCHKASNSHIHMISWKRMWSLSRNKPDFRCYLGSLLEHRLEQPNHQKSDKIIIILASLLSTASMGNVSRSSSRYTSFSSRSFFSISFTASCLSWISSKVFSTCSHVSKLQTLQNGSIKQWF